MMDTTSSSTMRPFEPMLNNSPRRIPPVKFRKKMSLQKRCSKRRPLKRCRLFFNKWESLNTDILMEILCRVPVQDLLNNVSAVCLSWEAACWNYFFWRLNVLDLSCTTVVYGFDATTDLYNTATKLCSISLLGNLGMSHYDLLDTKLMRLLFRIMEGDNISRHSLQTWTHSIQTIILPYDLEIADMHLIYIAERTPKLKKLLLLGCCRITHSGFVEAISNWRNLKELHLGPTNYDLSTLLVIEEIGKCCPQLELLHIHWTGNQAYFEIGSKYMQKIADCLPGLRKLVFKSVYVFPLGIKTFFEKCLHLEEVIFIDCDLHPCERVEGYNNYFGRYSNFRLSWNIDKTTGCARWKIMLYDCGLYKILTESVFRKWENSAQPIFDQWMFNHVGVLRRLC